MKKASNPLSLTSNSHLFVIELPAPDLAGESKYGK
jgi:hypothetical protein